MALVALGQGCEEESPAPPPPPRREVAAASARKRQECRDACDQAGIVTGGSDAQLRACRARCDHESPAPPNELPRSITVAPPTHTPPAVRPR